MKLLVYTRSELIDGALPPDHPALLLEGSWPAAATSRWSLDEAIGGRSDWIDRQAAEWSEMLAAIGSTTDGVTSPLRQTSPAYLNALNLRYYLVKLIRPVAYFTDVQPLRPGDRLELTAAASRDEDYADVLSQCCRAAGVHCRVRWVKGRRRCPDRFPCNAPWRRWAAWLSRCFQSAPGQHGSGRRVVLCGNPRLLVPVCRQLLARRCNTWWLYDRFAVGSWLRWQAAGVEQLVCNSSLGRENRLQEGSSGISGKGAMGGLPALAGDVSGQLDCRGTSLAAPIGRWLAEQAAIHGPRQTRLIEQIDAHFRRVRPETLVLDEDATGMARAAVAVARQYGAESLVVQHGVPCCRFGFAPLAADRILAWGRSSARQLIDWGVPAQRIRVTGLPLHDDLQNAFSPVRLGRRPRILLLTTVPPRDHRPDAVALHLTGHTYAEMLRTAFATVAGIDGAELIVKLHPRAGSDPVVRALRTEFRSLCSRVVRRGPLERWFAGVDCVLSCGSSAGVEATLAGLPVIQLAPPGGRFPSPEQWGMAGTAADETELQQLLARVLVEGWRPAAGPKAEVFAAVGDSAAARIAEEAAGGSTPQPAVAALQGDRPEVIYP